MKKFIGFSLLLLLTGFTASAQSYDMYLKAVAPPGDLGGMIIGNSTVKGHEKEMQIYSYSEGIATCSPNATKSGGLGACKPSISDLSVMTNLSPGYNQLRALMLTGKKLLSADLVFEKKGAEDPVVFYKIHMEDVTVTSAQEGGSMGGDSAPTISLGFAASRISWAIYRQKEDGTMELTNSIGFNVATGAVWNYAF